MKKRKIQRKKLSLHKNTIAAVNANAIQGGTIGTNITLLETRLAIICTTTTTVTNTVTLRKTVCEITCIECPTDNIIVCPGTIVKTTLC